MRIELSAPFIEWLADSQLRRTGRAPDRDELEALVTQHIDEEILVREAHRLGLANGDPIVRRRLAQKMRFLFEDTPDRSTDTDALRDFLANHQQRYTVGGDFYVSQVFLGPGTPSENELSKIKAKLEMNPNARVGRPLAIGRTLGFLDRAELTRLFSTEEARQIIAAPDGTWVGPVSSRFGQHLVRIKQRRPPRIPDLSEIEDRVKADFLRTHRSDSFDAEMSRLRAQYDIDVDWPRRAHPSPVATTRHSR